MKKYATVKDREGWSCERQARFVAGLTILVGILLAYFLSCNWIVLSILVALGMTLSAFTKECALLSVLSQMPWNKNNLKEHINESNSCSGSTGV